MKRIAGGGDPCLRQKNLVVVDAQIADGVCASGRFPKAARGYLGQLKGELDDNADERRVESETSHRADDAFLADRGCFDGSPILQDRQQRQHAVVGEVDVIDFITDLDENSALLQALTGHVRSQQVELVTRQS